MAVGMRVGSNVWLIGSQDFLHSFFSTCAYRLERDGWGSRFPALQKDLYEGELQPGDVPSARAELATIQGELKELPPSEVIWDIEELSTRPPWGDDISPEITDLSNYFVTQDGRDLLGVFDEALAYAERVGAGVAIQSAI